MSVQLEYMDLGNTILHKTIQFQYLSYQIMCRAN